VKIEVKRALAEMGTHTFVTAEAHAHVPRPPRTKTARTVEGHHCAPPWAVGVSAALRSRAICRKLLSFACSAWMSRTSSSSTRPGGAVCARDLQRLSSGAYRDRTGDLRLAKPALSQLS
jgi:hypothetical protein